jgi:hypothetical protein
MQNFVDATLDYEEWLNTRLRLVADDLAEKHQKMASYPFAFLRATFYRWIQLWPELLPELNRASSVLAVGDLHIANFGTWRDNEGRLVWGVNDFDEAWPLPWTQDLVRLAASAQIAIEEEQLTVPFKSACRAILEGWREGLHVRGRPFVLEERHAALRGIALARLKHPDLFWKKLDELPTLRGEAPPSVVTALRHSLSVSNEDTRLFHRTGGIGSLGRERYVLAADRDGGRVAREAKALTASAVVWASGRKSTAVLTMEAISKAVRCHDPFARVISISHSHGQRKWMLRRLAPDCCRVGLAEVRARGDQEELLHAMGFEVANVHLGSLRPAVLSEEERQLPRLWLRKASETMLEATRQDWREWARMGKRAGAGKKGKKK